MQEIIDFLSRNPIYAAVIVLLIILLVVSAMKKMVKLLVIVLIASMGYAYYLHGISRTPLDRAMDRVDVIGEKAGELIDRTGITD